MQQETRSYQEAKSLDYIKRQEKELEYATELMSMDSQSLEWLGKDLKTKIAGSKPYELNIDDELDELQQLVHDLEGLQQRVNKAVANLTEE